jgi:hypothetical protein
LAISTAAKVSWKSSWLVVSFSVLAISWDLVEDVITEFSWWASWAIVWGVFNNFIADAFMLSTFVSRVPDVVNFVSGLTDGTFLAFTGSAGLGDLVTLAFEISDWVGVFVLFGLSNNIVASASTSWVSWSDNSWTSADSHTFTVVAASKLSWLIGEFKVFIAGWAFLEVKSIAEDGGKTINWANFWFGLNIFMVDAFVLSAAVFAVPDIADRFFNLNVVDSDSTFLADSGLAAFWSNWVSKSWSGTVWAWRIVDHWAEAFITDPAFVWTAFVGEESVFSHAFFWSSSWHGDSWTVFKISIACLWNFNPTGAATFSW